MDSRANTREPLFLANRSGNRPSHEHADGYLDRAAAPCRRGGFSEITPPGDTDFTQTKHLDRWDVGGVRFVFGINAMTKLKGLAEDLPADSYGVLERPARYSIKTTPRGVRQDHKSPIVVARQFETIRLKGEEVAEFDYRPTACKETYRVVVLGKRLSLEQGQMVLFEEYRYFFYITNDRTAEASEIIFLSNGRCDQENLIAQLKGGVNALAMPVGDLVSKPLGVPSDREPGVEPEGVSGVAAARGRSVGGEAPVGEAIALADGVQHVLRGDDPGALPGRANVPPDRVPIAVMEPVAGRVPAVGGAAARSPAVLKRRRPEAGVRMLRSLEAPN